MGEAVFSILLTTNFIENLGTRVSIPISGLQKDPEYYDNPEEFNPDNFSQEKVDQRPDYTWLPFGFGPRQCIGNTLHLNSLIEQFK